VVTVPAISLSQGAQYLVDKYGGRPTVVAMRSAENEDGKSNIRGTRPVATMVSWVFDVEDIVAKNKKARVPGTKDPRNKQKREAFCSTRLRSSL
jgi:hypothetical protein